MPDNVVNKPPEGAKTSLPVDQWKGQWYQGTGGYWYPTDKPATKSTPPPAPTSAPAPPPAAPAPEAPKPTVPQIEVGIQQNTRETVSQADYARLDREAPLLANILRREGFEAYKRALPQFEATGFRLQQEQVNRTTEAVRVATERARVEAEAKVAPYKDWTAAELQNGRVENGVFTPSPYGVKGGVYTPYPEWAENKIVEAQNKAIKDLKPYLASGTTWLDVIKLVNEGRKSDAVQAAATVGEKSIDVAEAIKDGKEAQLRTLGVSPETIDQAKEYVRYDAIYKTVTGKPMSAQQKEKALNSLTQDFMTKDQTLRLETAKVMASLALDLAPVIGTYRYYQAAKADKRITAMEAVLLGASIAGDILFFTGIGAAVGTAARTAGGLSRTARMTAAVRGAKEASVAYLTAPWQVIRHPVETAKGAVKTVETIVRPSKIPLSATEVSYSTMRLPVKAFASGKEAMQVRDIATLAAIREGKFTSQIGDAKVTFAPARIQQFGGAAVHTTPDVRPFMEGVTITEGREGGLFVAPSLNTRFSMASAFGDMPEGGVRGAVIIRDQAILDTLGGSGKIYRGQVEIEALAKAGIKLPPPSQVLMTRAAKADVSVILKEAKALRLEGRIEEAIALESKAAALTKQGDKLALVVIGKPFTAQEIANLKFMGSLDNIQQMVTPAVRLTRKGKDISGAYDDLNAARREANSLVIEADRLRKAGNVTEAAATEARANELIYRTSQMAERLSSPAVMGGSARLALTMTRDTTLDRAIAEAPGGRIADIDLSQYRTSDIADALQGRPGRAVMTQDARALARGETIERQRLQVTQDSRRMARLDRTETEARRTIEASRQLEAADPRQRIAAEISREKAMRTIERVARDRAALRQEIARRAPMPVVRAPAATPRIPAPPRTEVPPRVPAPPRIEVPPRIPSTPPRTPPPRVPPIKVPPRIPSTPPRTPPPRVPPIKVPPKKPGVLLLGGNESKKRALLKNVEGLIARRRGQLGGKSVWHVHFYPFRDSDRVILLGDPPEGAITYTGPGSTDKSAMVVKGKPPSRMIFEDTGAVDDIIQPTKTRKLDIKSVVDQSVRIPKIRPPKTPRRQTRLNSVRMGKQYYTPIGGHIAISRRPLRRKRYK